MIERLRDALRDEGLKIFGATWSNDVAERLVRRVLAEMREPTEPTESMVDAGNDTQDGEITDSGNFRPDYIDAKEVWRAMLDEALEARS